MRTTKQPQKSGIGQGVLTSAAPAHHPNHLYVRPKPSPNASRLQQSLLTILAPTLGVTVPLSALSLSSTEAALQSRILQADGATRIGPGESCQRTVPTDSVREIMLAVRAAADRVVRLSRSGCFCRRIVPADTRNQKSAEWCCVLRIVGMFG